MATRTAWSACLLVLLFTVGSAEVPKNEEALQKSANDKSRTGAYVQSSEETEISNVLLISPHSIGQSSYLPSVQPGYTIQPGYTPSMQPGYLPPVQPGYQQQQETEYMVEYMAQDQQSREQHYIQPSYVPSVQPSYIPSVQPSYVPSVQPSYVPAGQSSYNVHSVTESELIQELLREEALHHSDHHQHVHLVQPSHGPLVQPSYVPSVQPHVSETDLFIDIIEPHVPSVQPGYGPLIQPNYQPSVQPNYVPSAQPGYISTVTETELIHDYLEEQHKQYEYEQSVRQNYGPLIQPGYPSVQPNYVPSVQSNYNNQPIALSELELLHEFQEQQPYHIHVPAAAQPTPVPLIHPVPVKPSYVPTVQPEIYSPPHYNIIPERQIYSRLIPVQEYILPHRQPGAENSVICQREGELHNFWSPFHECLVCTCVREAYGLEPVCVSCTGCALPPPPPPAPEPIIIPIVPTPEPQPVPVPTPIPEVVTCSPMPSGTPFQNPLNPCQVCICYESVSIYGHPDVKIECQENPQCVLPDVVPVIPDTPQPVPLPMCQQFPTNVLFPHPQEACKLCKCTVQSSSYGTLQDVIDCFPDPECTIPVPTPTPAPEIIVLPEYIVPEPIWPPAPTPAPTPIGPLPGPPPHESCRPFSPNQPFQHPWDECQVCICNEAYKVGRISIEVNCFTKKSCCIELPFESTSITAIKSLPVPTPSINPYAPLYPHYIPQEPEVVPNRVHPYPNPLGPVPHIIPGQHIHGQFVPGSYTPGQVVPGSYTPGQVVPGSYTPGQVVPGSYTPGQVVPGSYTSGQIVPGSYTPGHLVPGEYLPGNLVPGQLVPEMLTGPINSGHYRPGQYIPGHLVSGEVIPGTLAPGQLIPGEAHVSGNLLPSSLTPSNYASNQYSTGQVLPSSYPYSSNYGGGGSWSVTSESEYQEKDIEASSSTASTGFNQFSGNQGQNYHPLWKGLPSNKGIPGLHGLNLNQRPSHVYTNYGYDVNTSGGSYSPSYVVEEVYSGQPLISGQQGLISGQQALISGQQGLIAGQPGLISGQQGPISGPPLISSQSITSNGHPYAFGYNPSLNQGYTTVTKKFKTKSGEPDSSEEGQ